nr:MAG TPA: hypothetical protein [Caudoviricetes sp.]
MGFKRPLVQLQSLGPKVSRFKVKTLKLLTFLFYSVPARPALLSTYY